MVELRPKGKTFSSSSNQGHRKAGSGEEHPFSGSCPARVPKSSTHSSRSTARSGCLLLNLWWWITCIYFSVREKFPRNLLWALRCHPFQGEEVSSLSLSEGTLFSSTLIGPVRLIFERWYLAEEKFWFPRAIIFWVLIFPGKALHQKLFNGEFQGKFWNDILKKR